MLCKYFIMGADKREREMEQVKKGIREISETTGYSLATVSNALNHRRGVNNQTSARIFQAAQELGYLGSRRITKIRFVTYKKNGMIIEDTPFFPALIDGVEKEARLSGYETVFCTLDQRSPDYKEQLSTILNDHTAGIILLGTEMMEEDYRACQNVKIPLVVLDGWCDAVNLDSVFISNADSAFQATKYLIDQGHRHIGYLKGKFRIKNFGQRSIGMQQALRKHSLTLEHDDVVPLVATMEGAYQDMKAWLYAHDKLPTAFFADNDVIALGAIRALKEAGYRVPGDISVIGFDDLLLAEASSPRLTTVHVYNQEMGRLAVCKLVDIIKKGGRVKTKTQVCTEIVKRESVRNLNELSVEGS